MAFQSNLICSDLRIWGLLAPSASDSVRTIRYVTALGAIGTVGAIAF